MAYVFPAGSSVHPEATQELKENYFKNLKSVANYYGLSECWPLTMSWTLDSIGGVFRPDLKMYIRNIDTGKAEPANTLGEICFSSPNVMMGYLNRPDLTANFFMDDGFCKTGDMGYYDESGKFYLTGRIKEVIKYQGDHIYPEEIQNVIKRLYPQIVEVGVYGKPDPLDQELVSAIIR